MVILSFILVGIVLYFTRPQVISPCQKNGCAVKVVYAQDEQPDIAKVVDQTALEFSPEGSTVVHEALSIMWCEHRFNIGDGTDTPHLNSDGSYDYGTFQINSFWVKVFGTKFETDYKENIRVAHEIWKRSHSFNDWVCERYI